MNPARISSDSSATVYGPCARRKVAVGDGHDAEAILVQLGDELLGVLAPLVLQLHDLRAPVELGILVAHDLQTARISSAAPLQIS